MVQAYLFPVGQLILPWKDHWMHQAVTISGRDRQFPSPLTQGRCQAGILHYSALGLRHTVLCTAASQVLCIKVQYSKDYCCPSIQIIHRHASVTVSSNQDPVLVVQAYGGVLSTGKRRHWTLPMFVQNWKQEKSKNSSGQTLTMHKTNQVQHCIWLHVPLCQTAYKNIPSEIDSFPQNVRSNHTACHCRAAMRVSDVPLNFDITHTLHILS